MVSEKFAESCKVENITKAIFPYEKYSTIEEILQATSFPPYEDFLTSIWIPSMKLVDEFEQVINEELEKGTVATIR